MSLNPVIRVGRQVGETLRIHDPSINGRIAARQAVDMLAQLGIPDPKRVARRYPHELSGGMAQRIMIAMMLVTRPKLLIADEPTSALDVTIQAQILELMNKLIQDIQTAVLMITHDLGVMAESCDRVAVMYAGQIVEIGPVRDVIKHPQHPYTQCLLKTLPENADPDQPLYSIRGAVPTLLSAHRACGFAPRCSHRFEPCGEKIPPMFELGPGRQAACFLLRDHAVAATPEDRVNG
jgi:oligopeptide/dipeptide ABC transporter ATP-binding protein